MKNIQNVISHYQIILASNSPRRKELLSGLDIPYSVVTLPDIDESYPAYLHAEEIPLFISKKKCDAYKSIMKEDSLLITADTIVWHEERVFGKPKDRDDAKRMLRSLSGKTHQVITGVTLCSKVKERSFSALSEVSFALLEEDEIDYYLDHYQPYDKAGSYGVQEWIGYIGVESIKGSYFNVMGLPIQRLYMELQHFAI